MFVDTRRPSLRAPRAERAWRLLWIALRAMTGDTAELLAHRETPWASATFTGARHAVTLRFAGEHASDTADTFINALPEHEFAIPGQLVADAAIREVTYDSLPEPVTVVKIELLLVNED